MKTGQDSHDSTTGAEHRGENYRGMTAETKNILSKYILELPHSKSGYESTSKFRSGSFRCEKSDPDPHRTVGTLSE